MWSTAVTGQAHDMVQGLKNFRASRKLEPNDHPSTPHEALAATARNVAHIPANVNCRRERNDASAFRPLPLCASSGPRERVSASSSPRASWPRDRRSGPALRACLDPIRSCTPRWTSSRPPLAAEIHEHGRWPAATFRRGSNSPQRRCFTRHYREATISKARTGSCCLMLGLHLGGLLRRCAIVGSAAWGVSSRWFARGASVLCV